MGGSRLVEGALYLGCILISLYYNCLSQTGIAFEASLPKAAILS